MLAIAAERSPQFAKKTALLAKMIYIHGGLGVISRSLSSLTSLLISAAAKNISPKGSLTRAGLAGRSQSRIFPVVFFLIFTVWNLPGLSAGSQNGSIATVCPQAG